MTKASEAIAIFEPLLEDKMDDHISFLKNHPHVPDSLRRKLALLKKEKDALESQHDEVYSHWSQTGDPEAKKHVDAIDQRLEQLAKYIQDLVDEHSGLKQQ